MNDLNNLSHLTANFLLQNGPGITRVCRPSGDFAALFITDNVYEHLGYHAYEFISNARFWIDHIHPEDCERVFTDIELLFQKGTLVQEYRFLAADGNYHWIRDELRLIRDDTGQPLEIIGYWIDISDRVEEKEHNSRSWELTLTAAFEYSADAIVTADEEGRIQWFNKSAQALFGYSSEEAVGNDVKILVPKKMESMHGDFILRYRDNKNRYFVGVGPREIIGRRKDGTPVSIEISLSETILHGKSIYIAIIRDISERRRQEKERLALQRQLQAAKRMESIGQLVGGVAHEFNNILAIALGHAELGIARAESSCNAKLAEYFEQIKKASIRGRDIVRQLLVYTNNKEIPKKKNECLNLLELLEDMGNMLRAILPATIDLRIKLNKTVPQIIARKGDIQQILLDLCSNARDAMDEKGNLEITLRTSLVKGKECSSCGQFISGRFVEIAVADSGHGLEAEDIPRIFEPFYSTKPPGKGTGLGMSVLHGNVHGCGGHVIVESKKEQGTAVKILFLPVS